MCELIWCLLYLYCLAGSFLLGNEDDKSHDIFITLYVLVILYLLEIPSKSVL